MLSVRLGIAATALAVSIAIVPSSAHAQFGLGKLKKAKEMLEKGKNLKETADSVQAALKLIAGKESAAIDAGVYDRWVKAAAAERAALEAKNENPVAVGAAAGGFSVEDYSIVKAKIAAYVAAKTKSIALPEGILTPAEVAVLDGQGLEAIAKAFGGTK